MSDMTMITRDNVVVTTYVDNYCVEEDETGWTCSFDFKEKDSLKDWEHFEFNAETFSDLPVLVQNTIKEVSEYRERMHMSKWRLSEHLKGGKA
jgi:hypothetical protein